MSLCFSFAAVVFFWWPDSTFQEFSISIREMYKRDVTFGVIISKVRCHCKRAWPSARLSQRERPKLTSALD